MLLTAINQEKNGGKFWGISKKSFVNLPKNEITNMRKATKLFEQIGVNELYHTVHAHGMNQTGIRISAPFVRLVESERVVRVTER